MFFYLRKKGLRQNQQSFVLAAKKLFWQIKRQLDVLVHSLTRYFPLEQLEWEEQWNVPSGFPVALKGETAHCNQFELASSPLMPPCSFIVLLIWCQLASRCPLSKATKDWSKAQVYSYQTWLLIIIEGQPTSSFATKPASGLTFSYLEL